MNQPFIVHVHDFFPIAYKYSIKAHGLNLLIKILSRIFHFPVFFSLLFSNEFPENFSLFNEDEKWFHISIFLINKRVVKNNQSRVVKFFDEQVSLLVFILVNTSEIFQIFETMFILYFGNADEFVIKYVILKIINLIWAISECLVHFYLRLKI